MAQIQSFATRYQPTLQVFCPGMDAVITSLEPRLPEPSSIGFCLEPNLPTGPCWLKQGTDHHAYLPKDNWFRGHLFASLNNRKPLHVERGGRWYMDDNTRHIWRSLDVNLTKSIEVVARGLWVELEHREPKPALKYGFAHGHKTEKKLRLSLELSKNAFVHRFAYLTYLVSLRHRFDHVPVVTQQWWMDLMALCPRTWVDSVWDAIYQQWEARNYVGVVVNRAESSVKWIGAASAFGVPVWVSYPHPAYYDKVDGASVIGMWRPTKEQVIACRRANPKPIAAPPIIPPDTEEEPTPLPPAELSPEPESQPKSMTPPANIPSNGRWYESWEEFFRHRDEASARRLEAANETTKASWESLTQHAKKFKQPGKKGAKVYIWETCDSGGFFRILQTRHEVARDWESYSENALIFSPQHNSWDHCPFAWEPTAMQEGAPYDEDDGCITEHWYNEPELPSYQPNGDPEPLEYIYSQYGYISVEPTNPPRVILPFDKTTASRIVGLDPQSSWPTPEHLNSFITSVLNGQLPAGHCDLSQDSPPREMFAGKTSIRNTVFHWGPSKLSDEAFFVFLNNPDDSLLLAVHDALTVLQLVRAETQLQLKAEMHYAVRNGASFTLLYPNTRPLAPPRSGILPFPTRDVGWQPNHDDFRAYMSRLATLFLERPYIAAAAFSRGGIAWRIALEVVGIEAAVDLLLNEYPDQCSSVETSRGKFWYHVPDEGEWYYLVGGYEVLTGKGGQRQDLSWWPKVTTWEGSGLDLGRWTPMCEQWFQKRLTLIRSGGGKPFNSSMWAKYLKYTKQTKEFYRRFNNVGRDFLVKDCGIRKL